MINDTEVGKAGNPLQYRLRCFILVHLICDQEVPILDTQILAANLLSTLGFPRACSETAC